MPHTTSTIAIWINPYGKKVEQTIAHATENGQVIEISSKVEITTP